MTFKKPVRILIVDDHAMVRSGLKSFIDGYEWMKLVGEAANGSLAVEFCSSHHVDIILMDMVMPVMDGCEATQRILEKNSSVKVIILTSFHEQDRVEKALKCGATSYLLKNVTAEELAQAISAAMEGHATLALEATEALINATRKNSNVGFDLTPREKDVLALLVKGYSNSEISSSLSISMATTKYHLMNIFSKLDAKNRIEAVTIAIGNKLIQ
jgi:two-component system, NarL family, response regulator LiaR